MTDAPVTGNISVSIETATVVSDFLLVLLKLQDSPLTGDQIKEFSTFRDAVKAGPVAQTSTTRDCTNVLHDGIVVGNGPKMLLDRHLGIKYLRAIISKQCTPTLEAQFMTGLLDAISKKGPKKNTGINGTYCQGTFGYANPHEAKDYLCGNQASIVISRAKTQAFYMPTYFAETPNHFLAPDKVWTGPKDHVKTKFSDEETKNHHKDME